MISFHMKSSEMNLKGILHHEKIWNTSRLVLAVGCGGEAKFQRLKASRNLLSLIDNLIENIQFEDCEVAFF